MPSAAQIVSTWRRDIDGGWASSSTKRPDGVPDFDKTSVSEIEATLKSAKAEGGHPPALAYVAKQLRARKKAKIESASTRLKWALNKKIPMHYAELPGTEAYYSVIPTDGHWEVRLGSKSVGWAATAEAAKKVAEAHYAKREQKSESGAPMSERREFNRLAGGLGTAWLSESRGMAAAQRAYDRDGSGGPPETPESAKLTDACERAFKALKVNLAKIEALQADLVKWEEEIAHHVKGDTNYVDAAKALQKEINRWIDLIGTVVSEDDLERDFDAFRNKKRV